MSQQVRGTRQAGAAIGETAMWESRARLSSFGIFGVLLLASSAPALAYAGPGAGLTMIGSLVALLSAVFAGIYGFIWYPVKRLLKRRKRGSESADDE